MSQAVEFGERPTCKFEVFAITSETADQKASFVSKIMSFELMYEGNIYYKICNIH